MLRVLVADDDRGIRELLQIALEAEGYAITTFADGRGVVEQLAQLVEPCVLLLDLSMPVVTGWDVCAALAANPALLGAHQILILTAEPLPTGACPVPARALLAKPFDLDAVCACVAALFASPQVSPLSELQAASVAAVVSGPVH